MNYDRLIRKKAYLDEFRPLSAAPVGNLDDWFRVELTHTGNAVERNTLTRRETGRSSKKG